MPRTRIIFSSDFHGADVVWRKFLNSASMFKANVLLMGGDMTSKVMVPIVQEDGIYTVNFLGKQMKITEAELPEIKKDIRKHTYLPYVCSKSELEELNRSPDHVENVFEQLEIEMLKDWISLIPQKASGVKVIFHPGN